MSEVLFCAVENDEFERIVFVEKDLKTLARKIGVSYSTIRSGKSRGSIVGGYKILKVEIEEKDVE
jgi:hypothetical protein